MKKFQFSLDMVLRYKQQVLESVQAEHAAALAEVRRQEQLLEDLENRYREFDQEYCQRKLEGITAGDALVYQGGLRALEREIRRETEVLRRLRLEEQKKRERVVAAKQETSSLEKLREKKLAQYRKDEQKSEEQFIEEFVSSTRSRSA
ncbi:MAG: flagellar export protein FliJ [Acutalibacter sp.]